MAAAAQAPAQAKPRLTVSATGEVKSLICDCHRFKTNAILFGEGDCEHVQVVRSAMEKRG